MKLNIKIYNLDTDVDVARDWGIQAQSVPAHEALQQPFKIACVPACYTYKWNFAFRPTHSRVDLSKFDLVLISDIEQERMNHIDDWARGLGIKNYLVALGAYHNSETIDSSRMVYRPWWMYNMMRLNQAKPLSQKKSAIYWFDALLGARRPHRDFVMLNFQKHPRLLDQSLVTYRSGFIGEVIDDQTQAIHDYFPGIALAWPYVSPALPQAWEIQEQFDKSLSPYVPWKIYNESWYSVICETSFTGDSFFPTEKISKAMYAGRIFVVFAPCQFLKYLRHWGFQTFSTVIDEGYDEELVDLERYKKAWAQMLSLTYQNPRDVYDQLQPVLAHNQQHMIRLQQQTQNQMHELLVDRIPQQFIITD